MLPFFAMAPMDLSEVVFWGVIGLIVIVPTLGHYLYKWRKAELDAQLKGEMIARGMSADEIERVLLANSLVRNDETPA